MINKIKKLIRTIKIKYKNRMFYKEYLRRDMMEEFCGPQKFVIKSGIDEFGCPYDIMESDGDFKKRVKEHYNLEDNNG